MHKPSKADVLKVAEEPVAWLWEDVPRKYVQINGKGPTYCLHGTSSINAFKALEAALEFEKSQHVKSKNAYHAEREVSDKLEKALKDTLSHLVAAASLLSRSPKTAAPSNKMFDQMVVDYKAAAKRASTALTEVAALRKKETS